MRIKIQQHIMFSIKPKLFILLILFIINTSVFSIQNKQLPKQGTGPWIVDVYYDDIAQLRNYVQINEPWYINREKMFFTLSVENLHQYQELFSYGFNVEINQKQMEYKKHTQDIIAKALISGENTKAIPGFSCMRTVEETFSSMDSLVAAHPTLATVLDVGDTWEKITAGGNAGYDMRVIKITNSAIAGPKPILYVTSAIHAREIAPAELNMRFAEYLLNNYGTDADATWIVDHREVHLMPQGNPDGRKRAESADTNKRKTQNNNYCPGSNTRGIDMNRNYMWMWNQGSGSSGSECNQTYRGPSAQSEPENTAIDTYLKTLFVDARGPNLGDAAPSDTSGVYLDIHSVASLVLWPYGFDDAGTIPLAPNHNQLQTLGRKFSWYNNYYPEPANQLYGADGAADDNAYGQLGVAAYTFELGGGSFRPSCSTFENSILPDNLEALIYAAKVADTPYITAQGPDIENLGISSNEVSAGIQITVTGIANDAHFNNSNGTESTQNITSVEMFVDELPWENASTPVLMSAVDGNFNSNNESFTGTLNTTGLTGGQHILYVVSTDNNGITGVPYAKFFTIVDPNNLGTVSGVVRNAMSNQIIASVNVNLDSQQTVTNAQGQFDFTIIPGNYTLTASKQGFATVNINNVTVTAQQNTVQDIQLQPVCSILDDNVDGYNSIANAVSADWSHGAVQGNDDWMIDATGGVSNSKSFSSNDVGITTDKYLATPNMNLTASSSMEFWHKFDFEGGSDMYDGGVLEISITNGSSWTDLGSNITSGGYTVTLNGGYSQPLGSVSAWGGTQNTFTKVEVDLSSYAGQTAMIRWRMGTDSTTSAGAWKIDDIKVLDPSVCVNPDIIYASGFE